MSLSPATDPKQACLDFFASFQPLSETTRAFLEERLVVHELNRDTRLFSGGQVLEELYYIHEGLLRHYYFNETGRETTGWFAAETEILYFPADTASRLPHLAVWSCWKKPRSFRCGMTNSTNCTS